MLLLWTGVAAVGVGLATGHGVPSGLAWPPIVLGAAMVVVSVATILAGQTAMTARASGALAGLTAIWSIALGIRLAR